MSQRDLWLANYPSLKRPVTVLGIVRLNPLFTKTLVWGWPKLWREYFSTYKMKVSPSGVNQFLIHENPWI